jgi:hypothetical protein
MARASSDNTDRILRARMAAHLLHAQISDPAEHTAPARAAFLSRFEREVDPDGILDPKERARRAEHAKKAYFIKLALASRKARAAKRRANTNNSPAADNDDGGQA